MCGIFGIISKDDKKYAELTNIVINKKKQKIIDNLTPRGPDSQGEYYDDKCYFISTRLKICDTDDASNQPFQHNGIVLVFNGEIYNHQELREQLREFGYHFNTMSDTEVIIKLYEREGLQFVDKLNGIFAFCLYDTKRKEVYIYRDRLGVKPLFYYETDQILIFSSDIPSILECLDTQKLVPTSISSYLSFRNVLGQNTFFEGIKKLMAGYYIIIHRNRSSIYEYWSLKTENVDYIPDIYE